MIPEIDPSAGVLCLSTREPGTDVLSHVTDADDRRKSIQAGRKGDDALSQTPLGGNLEVRSNRQGANAAMEDPLAGVWDQMNQLIPDWVIPCLHGLR